MYFLRCHYVADPLATVSTLALNMGIVARAVSAWLVALRQAMLPKYFNALSTTILPCSICSIRKRVCTTESQARIPAVAAHRYQGLLPLRQIQAPDVYGSLPMAKEYDMVKALQSLSWQAKHPRIWATPTTSQMWDLSTAAGDAWQCMRP